MLKSTAGGGGIGMRVRSAAELTDAFDAVKRLGQNNFSDSGVFIEKYIERARHLEVQVFGDGAGEVIALGVRDCSVQRRNQKVLEETPAPNLPTGMAEALCEAAITPGQGGQLSQRRHRGVRLRRRNPALLLPGGKHPSAGGAWRYRAGLGRGSGALDDRAGRRRPAAVDRAGEGSQAERPRDPGARLPRTRAVTSSRARAC